MRDADLVVADTSPLLGLALIDRAVAVEEASLFAEFRSELDALRSAGFWISDTLYEEVIELADDDLE